MSIADALTGHVHNAENQPDLVGNLFPVASEHDVAQCDISGELPEGLNGSFIRNGPNPLFEPMGRYHMFDGDGMLHSINFEDGKVAYRNRWIRSQGLQVEARLGRAIYPGLSDVLAFPDPALVGDAGPVKNPANTHIVRHADKFLALWEGGLPTEVTASLDTIGEYDFGGQLRGSMTAHPRLDPRTGEMFFFAYSVFEPLIRYYAVDASGALVHSVEIDLPAPIMMHDFVITEEYAIFLDSPIVFDVANVGKGPMVNWLPDNGSRLGVMPRMGAADEIRWFDIDTGHVQHFWNAWAEGDRIHLSGCRFAHPDFGIESDGPLDESAASSTPGVPTKFWIDLAADKVGSEQFDDLGGDFCRIDDRFNGVRTRYHYMSAFMEPGRRIGDFDSIVRYDDLTGTRQEWCSGPNGHVGESVFAPNPSGTEDDDGWLLNAVYDSSTDTTDLCVLDASDVSAGPIARVHVPHRLPFGFHANWFAAE